MSAASRIPALRWLARRRGGQKACELCGVALAPAHAHLIDPVSQRLLCSCKACSLLFEGRRSGRYRTVPEAAFLLADFQMTETQWDDLRIPIELAFFYRRSATDQITAVYPSPAGPIESALPLDAWHELEADNPVLREMEPDVEALLVNRLGLTPEHFRVGIDECYRLVGLIRGNWRGLSGGGPLWEAVSEFFRKLRQRSGKCEGARHA